MTSCLIVAGEKSGEEHVLSFYDDLVADCPKTSFYGVAGDALEAKGFELLYHLRDFSTLGIVEAISRLGFYLKAVKAIEAEVARRKTETAILVDFQDFNMFLAKKLKKRGVKILYYVAPTAWIWRPGRAKALAQRVHTLFTIFPFERKWFESRGVGRVKTVQHPLLTKYRKRLSRLQKKSEGNREGTFNQNSPEKKARILLLPGSRTLEITSLLPEFLWAVSELKKGWNIEVGVVKAQSIREELFARYPYPFDVVYEETRLADALEWAHICLAASGTVTLSCALFQVPTIVAYKMNLFNETIFSLLSAGYKGPISLPNIIKGQKVFPEFLQVEANGFNFLRILKLWLTKAEVYEKIGEQLKTMPKSLEGEDIHVAKYMASVIHSHRSGPL
ncbi:MAG: hypothetical protein OXB88_04480 [Bacteriovoracales bacterium]|nr:hypothetical protein [Bacteriovoracales bacterium]